MRVELINEFSIELLQDKINNFIYDKKQVVVYTSVSQSPSGQLYYLATINYEE